MANPNYRKTILATTLKESIDELLEEGQLKPEYVNIIWEEFDKEFAKSLANNPIGKKHIDKILKAKSLVEMAKKAKQSHEGGGPPKMPRTSYDDEDPSNSAGGSRV